VPHFLAQTYIAHREEAIAAVGRARQIRSPLLLRAIFVPSDEIFLTLWNGPSADAVDATARDVGLGPGRVVRVEEMTAHPALSKEDEK
jgi:hypothetical protein